MADEIHGFMIPDEPQVMEDIKQAVFAAVRVACEGKYVPMPVVVNAVATAMAQTTMLAILNIDQEREDGQEFEMEAFRRIMDAVGSMEDYRDRKAPWRLQCAKMKTAERSGMAVMNMAGMKATKQ